MFYLIYFDIDTSRNMEWKLGSENVIISTFCPKLIIIFAWFIAHIVPIYDDENMFAGEYQMIISKKSWEEAKVVCEDMDMHLAVINSAEEQAAAETFIRSQYASVT